MQDPLGVYAARLLKAKGVPETDEARDRLLKEMNDAIDQALIEALPLKQLDKLELATKSNNVNENLIEQLLVEIGARPSEIINNALQNFQNTYLKGGK